MLKNKNKQLKRAINDISTDDSVSDIDDPSFSFSERDSASEAHHSSKRPKNISQTENRLIIDESRGSHSSNIKCTKTALRHNQYVNSKSKKKLKTSESKCGNVIICDEQRPSTLTAYSPSHIINDNALNNTLVDATLSTAELQHTCKFPSDLPIKYSQVPTQPLSDGLTSSACSGSTSASTKTFSKYLFKYIFKFY